MGVYCYLPLFAKYYSLTTIISRTGLKIVNDRSSGCGEGNDLGGHLQKIVDVLKILQINVAKESPLGISKDPFLPGDPGWIKSHSLFLLPSLLAHLSQGQPVIILSYCSVVRQYALLAKRFLFFF